MKFILAIAIGIVVYPSSAAWGQPNTQSDQTFEITIPPNVKSEQVQIQYLLVGGFGGYGSFVKPEVGKRSYSIPTTVESKSATGLKAIIYSLGCKFVTVDVPTLAGSSRKADFICKRLPTTALSGRIQQPEALRGHEYELVVNLTAPWGMKFFGIEDGIVPSFHITTVTPSADGSFHARLPNFFHDATSSDAKLPSTFRLVAREKQTGNNLGKLLPADAKSNQSGGLRLRARYSGEVAFSIQRLE
jgi:hypothetical protein